MLSDQLVSIVIPTFNRADRLQRAVASCLDQTHRAVEVIVVDDGSTDGTSEVLRSLTARDERVRSYRQVNNGACSARNRGIDESRGSYLQLLDSDDTLDAQKLAVQVEALERTGGAIAVCDYRHVCESGEAGRTLRNDGDLLLVLSGFHHIFTATPLLRRSIIADKVRFNENLRVKQDTEFFFKAFLIASDWVYTPGVLCEYVEHDEGRITDLRSTDVDEAEIFASTYAFFLAHRCEVSPRGPEMMRRLGLRMANRLYLQGERLAAREICSQLMRRPGAGRDALKLLYAWIRSATPEAIVRSLRVATGRVPYGSAGE